MTIKFDEDAVSENIRNLLAQGVGKTIDGVPSFNNADIELHQNIIRRERASVLLRLWRLLVSM